jgi:signal transduction histidine kinase
MARPPATSAVERGKYVVIYAGTLYRAYGLTQVTFGAALGGNTWWPAPPMLWFTLVVAVESLAVIAICVWRRAFPPALITFDAFWNAGALFAGAYLTRLPSDSGWVDYMFTYTIITAVSVGFTFRRYLPVLGITIVLAGAYAVSDVEIQHVPVVGVLTNAFSYATNTGVAWLVARYLYRLNERFDASRAEALARIEALAKERERLRHARMLHDRVLQTLETLGRGEWVSDRDFRGHIAAEAAWLRGLVEGIDDDRSPDLLTGLNTLVQRKAKTGLHVTLNAAMLHDASFRDLDPAGTEALVGAAHEILTNVAKHSGVMQALMRVSVTCAEVTVSVLDCGTGFDPSTVERGIGLDESITRRIADVGGRTLIDSSPGGGTYVEVSVPLAGVHSSPEKRSQAD